MPRFVLPLLVSLLANGSAALAAESDFTLYSNICQNSQSGDLGGTRIGLLTLADGTYVFYQEAEGWADKAQIIKLSPEPQKKSRLEFDVRMDGGESRHIRGTLTKSALLLTSGGLRDGEKVLRLNKVTMPDRVPQCR